MDGSQLKALAMLFVFAVSAPFGAYTVTQADGFSHAASLTVAILTGVIISGIFIAIIVALIRESRARNTDLNRLKDMYKSDQTPRH